MIKVKTKIFGGLIIAFLSLNVSHAQKAIRIAIMNESIALPSFKPSIGPFHPTLNLGADMRERGSKHWKRTLGADAYSYYHRQFEHAIMLDAL